MSSLRFPRLKDSPELGDYLNALDEQPLSEARMSQNAASIQTQIAAGAAGTSALTTGAVLKLGLPLLLAAGAVGAYLVASNPELTISQEESSVIEHPVQEIESSKPQALTPTALKEDPKAAALEAPKPPKKQGPSALDTNTQSEKAATSVLPVQLALYRNAKSAGQKRNYAMAVSLLNQLLQDYPATPLKAEAELSRVEFLTRQGAFGKAIPELNRLLSKVEHAGRQGELLRLLGDLHRQKSDCSQARKAYDRASSFRLNARDQAAVYKGLELCPPPSN